jgi:hypothetical protein
MLKRSGPKSPPTPQVSNRYPTGIQQIFNKYPTGVQQVSKRYPTGIQQVSNRYPTGIQQIFNKYPTGIQQVSNRYPTGIQQVSNKQPTDTQQVSNKYPTGKQTAPRRAKARSLLGFGGAWEVPLSNTRVHHAQILEAFGGPAGRRTRRYRATHPRHAKARSFRGKRRYGAKGSSMRKSSKLLGVRRGVGRDVIEQTNPRHAKALSFLGVGGVWEATLSSNPPSMRNPRSFWGSGGA